MKLAPFAVALALATCICLAADPPKESNTPSANAAKPPPPKAFINEAEAGPDFKIQGEYFGESGDLKLGIQVIALGKEGFEAVVYRDGLPGDGSLKGFVGCAIARLCRRVRSRKMSHALRRPR